MMQGIERLNRGMVLGIPLVFFILGSLTPLPFWGDSIASVSKAALNIYDKGLHQPWNMPTADPGHPTLFPWLIALGWKLFSVNLWWPHALITFCLWGILKEMKHRLAMIEPSVMSIALLIAALAPLSVSLGLGIGLQAPLTYLFLLNARLLQQNKWGWFALGCSAMLLIHLQGMLLFGALGLWQLLRNGKNWKRSAEHFWIWLIPATILSLWFVWHKATFGWAISTPVYSRALPTAFSVLYNWLITGWRLMDLGYWVLSIPALLQVLKLTRKGTLSQLALLYVSTFVCTAVAIPALFAYPPSHRYYWPLLLLAVPLAFQFMQHFSAKRQLTLAMMAFVILMTGHVWHYPGKCLGDQNLVHLGYLELEKEIVSDFPSVDSICGYAPLNNHPRYTWLKPERQPIYADLYHRDFAMTKYVIESNLTCEFTETDQRQLWHTHEPFTYRSYGIYATLWVNKALNPDISLPSYGHYRPSAFENWIKSKKN